MKHKDKVKLLRECGLLALVEAKAREHHVTLREILDTSQRLRSVTEARHSAWQALRAKGMSYSSIARFWWCDHTTVLAACRDVEPGKQAV